MKITLVVCACSVLLGATLNAQSITTEVAINAGASTEEDVRAAATEMRVFGDAAPRLRYYGEVAWAGTSDQTVGAFGTAYPYGNRVQIIEAYGESILQRDGAMLDVQAGRFRTPFGISAGSDHGYTGFLRAPLLRYDNYFALSNNFLEHGVNVAAGAPWLSVEASLGTPADVGTAVRRSGLDTVVRLQSAIGPFIVGASHIRTSPYQPEYFAKGLAEFSGVDVRWMRDGVELRGEWITGRPFDGTTTSGWYADAIVHRVAMGPVTAVARVEQLDYVAPAPFDTHSRRQTLGARIRIVDRVSVQVNVLHQTGTVAVYSSTALDVGATYSVRLP